MALAPVLVSVFAVDWLGRGADLDNLKQLLVRQQDGIFYDHWWGFFRGLLIFFCALQWMLNRASPRSLPRLSHFAAGSAFAT